MVPVRATLVSMISIWISDAQQFGFDVHRYRCQIIMEWMSLFLPMDVECDPLEFDGYAFDIKDRSSWMSQGKIFSD